MGYAEEEEDNSSLGPEIPAEAEHRTVCGLQEETWEAAHTDDAGPVVLNAY